MVNCAPTCPRGNMDKTKEWQMEMLMEKLRSKANQYRSFYDSAKALRMTLMEKRFSIDSLDRTQLQKCLDTLQQNMKVTTHQAMVERLESVSRQLGLKFVSGQSGLELFISCDMFYLEILLESNGGVKDVKIHHESRSDQQPQSCEELVSCLARRDFADLTAQLEGLSSIYQINAEKKTKARAYTALTSLETDVLTLASIHSSYTKDPFTIVHATPLGFVQKRRGGHPMKLTYLIPPYQLIDITTRTMKPLELKQGLDLGFSVSVCVESSTAHKLQTAPLVSLTRTPNGTTPETYSPLSASNSMTVAGCFALTLSRPMVVCTTLVAAMEAVTGISIGLTAASPLLGLLLADAGATPDNLFVNVADQHHCYLLTESGLTGVMVKTIPFTHPSHIGQVISILRKQALFNTVISSCIRPNTPQDIEKMIMLEVSPLSCEHVSVSVEHPFEECMATVELDLSDITALKCRVYTSSGDPTSAATSSEYATSIFQKTMSIPVTMRNLIRMWNMEQAQRMSGLYNGGGGGLGGGGAGGGTGEHDVEFDPDIKIKLEPGGGSTTSGFSRHSGGAFDSERTEEEERRGTKRKRKDDWSDKNRFDDSMDSSSSSSSPAPPSLEFIASTDIGDINEKTVSDQDSRDSDVSKAKKKRREEKKSAADILLDLEHKNLVPPSVSITPISSSQITTPSYSSLSDMSLEGRPGLEIIPLPTQPTAPLPSSSYSIIPLPHKSQESKSDKKSSKSRSDQKSKPEKKKKRKRDESPSMGPPEKLPPKSSDPLSKPVSVSIKPTESLSPRPSSPAIRKYPSSPTHTSPLALSSLTGKSSPTLSKAAVKASPKHSPISYSGSPKNSLTSSPKHGSPKHQSNSGKPSLSALKSSVTSPSKSDSKSKSKDSKDRDKKSSSSSGYSSPKSKGSSSNSSSSSSSGKVKGSGEGEGGSPSSVQSGGSSSPSGDGGKSSAGALHLKNRKGSLSAVVDKLKSALGEDDHKKERTSSSSGSVSTAKVGADSKLPPKPGDKSGEYSVKQHSDGMKLTINKKSRESSKSKSSSSSSSSDSPKSHTGAKTSSSASRKLAHSKSSSGISSKSSSSSRSLVRSSSSSSLKPTSKASSPKPGERKKDKPRPRDKSLLSQSEFRKMSPSLSDGDFPKSFPLSFMHQSADSEVLLVALSSGKLDRGYQIPKLSARLNTDADKKKDRSSSDSPKTDSKDKFSKDDSRSEKSKYYSSSASSKVSKLPIDLSDTPNISIIPVSQSSDKSGGSGADGGVVDDILQTLKMNLPMSSISMTPVEKEDSGKKVEVSDLLLDLTGGGKEGSSGSPGSISLHIVKSPASATPLVMSSPNPPFIDDDELMDEAVVGNCK